MSETHPVRNSCAATSRTGKPCQFPPIPGGAVCRFHGGAAPQVRRKAMLRLLELVDPAVATMARIMVDTNAKDADRLRAAENVLDRAGLGRQVDVVDLETAKDLLFERLLSLRDGQDTIPGEVVRDTDTQEVEHGS